MKASTTTSTETKNGLDFGARTLATNRLPEALVLCTLGVHNRLLWGKEGRDPKQNRVAWGRGRGKGRAITRRVQRHSLPHARTRTHHWVDEGGNGASGRTLLFRGTGAEPDDAVLPNQGQHEAVTRVQGRGSDGHCRHAPPPTTNHPQPATETETWRTSTMCQHRRSETCQPRGDGVPTARHAQQEKTLCTGLGGWGGGGHPPSTARVLYGVVPLTWNRCSPSVSSVPFPPVAYTTMRPWDNASPTDTPTTGHGKHQGDGGKAAARDTNETRSPGVGAFASVASENKL